MVRTSRYLSILACAGCLIVILWIFATGGGVWHGLGQRWDLTNTRWLWFAAVLCASCAWVSHPHSRGRYLARRIGRSFRASNPSRKLGMLAATGLLISNLADLARVPDTVPPKLERTALGRLHVGPSELHTRGLLDKLVAQPAGQATCVRIEDRDARGWTAAFLLYPRLLSMEPAERAWARREWRDRSLGLDHSAQPRPQLELSRNFAADRGEAVWSSAPGRVRLEADKP